MKPLPLLATLWLAACTRGHRDDAKAATTRALTHDDSVEALAMARSPQPVTRSGLTLRISHTRWKPTELTDDTTADDRYVRYRYNAYLPRLHAHLVEVQWHNMIKAMLLHDASGTAWSLEGLPLFSPGGTRFAAASPQPENDWPIAALQVWSAEAGYPRLLCWLDFGNEWMGSDLRWVDENTLEFHRILRRDGRTSSQVRVELEPDGFRLRAVR